MSDLTAKFAALETQLATQQTALLSSMADINTALGFLGTSLDIMIANNATNTKLLLAAIGQNSPCMPCPTPPIVIPPFGDTTLPINPEACQRAQAFLNFMMAAFTVLDVASAVGVGFNPSLITDAFNQVIAGLSGGDSPNAISFPEGVQLVGDLINYIAANVTRGATLVDSFSPLYFDLRNALYIAASPAEARAQYVAVINASGLDSDIKTVLRDAAYNDLYSYFFDPASSPDLSGIDGAVCTGGIHDITSCRDFDAVAFTFDGHDYYYISGAPVVAPNAFYFGGDFHGWSFSLIAGTAGRGVDVYRTETGSDSTYTQGHSVGGGPQVMSQHSLGIAIVTHDIDSLAAPFTMRICPPA